MTNKLLLKRPALALPWGPRSAPPRAAALLRTGPARPSLPPSLPCARRKQPLWPGTPARCPEAAVLDRLRRVPEAEVVLRHPEVPGFRGRWRPAGA